MYYASFPLAIIGIGFLTIYFGNFRGTGGEVLGDKHGGIVSDLYMDLII